MLASILQGFIRLLAKPVAPAGVRPPPIRMFFPIVRLKRFPALTWGGQRDTPCGRRLLHIHSFNAMVGQTSVEGSLDWAARWKPRLVPAFYARACRCVRCLAGCQAAYTRFKLSSLCCHD